MENKPEVFKRLDAVLEAAPHRSYYLVKDSTWEEVNNLEVKLPYTEMLVGQTKARGFLYKDRSFLKASDLEEKPVQQVTQEIANPKEKIGKEGAPEGNQNALKFDTSEKRQAFLQAYIAHREAGYSKESFTYQGSGIKTFDNYRENFPVDFPTEAIEEAEAKNRLFWETIGINGTVGIPVEINGKKYDKFNAISWKFNMQNRHGWKEKTDMTSDDEKIQAPVLYIPKEDPEL